MAGSLNWLNLFDTGEVEHVCELVVEDFRAQGYDGFVPRLHLSLRSILATELNAYLSAQAAPTRGIRVDIEAAENLLNFVTSLANRIERKKSRRTDAEKLQQLWVNFIAMASAHRMYHDLPLEKAKAEKRRKTAAANASEPRAMRGKLPSGDVLRAELDRTALTKGKRNAVAIVAERYGATAAAVRKKRKKKSAT